MEIIDNIKINFYYFLWRITKSSYFELKLINAVVKDVRDEKSGETSASKSNMSSSYRAAYKKVFSKFSSSKNRKGENKMIKVIGTKENKDGSLNVEIEYKEEFKEFLKGIYKKRFSKALVKKFIEEAIIYYAERN